MTAHHSPAATILAEVAQDLGIGSDLADGLRVTGEEKLASCFPVTDLAVASIGAAGLALADLVGTAAPVTVDRHLASAWFRFSIVPVGWSIPQPWDAIAGDYQAEDGWIRLHTNAPLHRDAALRVLNCANDRDTVAAHVVRLRGEDLEAAVVEAGGCAAVMRSSDEWRLHPQGQAAAREPLIGLRKRGDAKPWTIDPQRPLRGIRVLDLTRILAGPVATRFLAGLGAEVLRIDPPGWDEPTVAPDVTLGKRCARLDLHDSTDRACFQHLLAQADVLVHGYRPGALDALGLGEAERAALNPGLIDVSLCAWGWSGPWATRRGFDSLVQMASGIADAGRLWQGAERPVPLPVQALDHATGYLMAAAVLGALALRQREQVGTVARLSLARTALSLTQAGMGEAGEPFGGLRDSDWNAAIEQTAWGPARRLRSPMALGSMALTWDLSASPLGSAQPAWQMTR